MLIKKEEDDEEEEPGFYRKIEPKSIQQKYHIKMEKVIMDEDLLRELKQKISEIKQQRILSWKKKKIDFKKSKDL